MSRGSGCLLELCGGSELQAEIRFADVPVLEKPDSTPKGCIPEGPNETSVHMVSTSQILLRFRGRCCDPQTSGGLLSQSNLMEYQGSAGGLEKGRTVAIGSLFDRGGPRLLRCLDAFFLAVRQSCAERIE